MAFIDNRPLHVIHALIGDHVLPSPPLPPSESILSRVRGARRFRHTLSASSGNRQRATPFTVSADISAIKPAWMGFPIRPGRVEKPAHEQAALAPSRAVFLTGN